MKVLFAAGGTAGHINPALAIAKYIKQKKPDCDMLFIGTAAGMEKKLVPNEGFPIKFIEVKGLKRKITPDNLKTIKALVKGTIQARKIIKDYKPDIVIATGGYVSVPVVFNAALMGIRTMIHEQNVFPGMAIKILSKFASVVAISFEESKKYLRQKNKLILTGNPIRQNIIEANYHSARVNLGLDDRPFILAFGGSLGAEKINNTIIEAIKYMIKDNRFQLMVGTGEKQYKSVIQKLNREGINLNKYPGITVKPYINNMNDAMAAADLVICRAGAITISEITALGKPSILIPSPNVTHNHQEYNARALEKQGAAKVLLEKELNGRILFNEINKLFNNQDLLHDMKKNSLKLGITNSTEKIYNIVNDLVKG